MFRLYGNRRGSVACEMELKLSERLLEDACR